MRNKLRILCGLLATVALTATMATASRDDRKTALTVNDRIEVPGYILTPGEYTMEITEGVTANRVVLFRDSEGELMTSTMALPAQRADGSGTKFTFYEMPTNHPPAMRTWFYPGETIGLEFVYPESRSAIISKHARRNVPSMPDEKFEKIFSTAHGPDITAVRDITIYAVSPMSKKLKAIEAQRQNAITDRSTWDSSLYLQSRELEESRVERQIRKEIVTLPFYSLWDHITFSVAEDGEVTVNGKVYRPSLKNSLEKAVSRVEGVADVNNQVDVLPVSPRDNDLRLATYQRVYGHSALQRYQMRAVPPIHIIVENGDVTLEGVVSTQMEKTLAGIQASGVNGAQTITNNLRVQG